MAYYQRHIFFCANQRENGKQCCAQGDAVEYRTHMKKRLKELKLSGAGKHRVNLVGCIGRCSEGPVVVIYPDEIWYSYSSIEDIDEIIDTHLIRGEVVTRLKLSDELAKITD